MELREATHGGSGFIRGVERAVALKLLGLVQAMLTVQLRRSLNEGVSGGASRTTSISGNGGDARGGRRAQRRVVCRGWR